jgi:type IV pilus assembly protein PilM
MNLLPKASGTRPRLACEISPEAVVAARAADAVTPIDEVGRVTLAEGAVAPGLRPGNLIDRLAVIAAMRGALESIGVNPNSRGADVTLVVPDGAMRVLLLDFDALPGKVTEALPIVRFRLKKLLPFEADDAMISYQVMSSTKGAVRVLAVAMPRDILAEYETAMREAGYEPGAVLPSTLAAIPAVASSDAALIVNAGRCGITTAIVREGVLLLHRSIDLQSSGLQPSVDGGGFKATPSYEESSAAAQRFPHSPELAHSPYLAPTLAADLNAEIHNAILVAPTSLGTLTETGMTGHLPEPARAAFHEPGDERLPGLASLSTDEIAQAVSVAAAYFEDTLSAAPATIFSAGPMGAEELRRILEVTGVGGADGLQVRELVDSSALLPEAISASVSRSALAGVAGALRG